MFCTAEHDLNVEIDRLVQASANYKRHIAELECRLLSSKLDADYPFEDAEVSSFFMYFVYFVHFLHSLVSA